MLVQDRLARNVEAGGVYALADRAWRVRFDKRFVDAQAAGSALSIIYDVDTDPDIVTGVGEPVTRDVRRRRFLDLLS